MEVYEALEEIAPGLSVLVTVFSGKRREEITLEDVEHSLRKIYDEKSVKLIVSVLSRRLELKKKRFLIINDVCLDGY